MTLLFIGMMVGGCSAGKKEPAPNPGKSEPEVPRQQAPAGRGVTKGFKFPDYDQQRRLKSMLTGKEARAEASDHIRITALHVETYREDGKVELVVEAPECIFDRKSRVASSGGSVEARSADGRFFISGEGFEWRQLDSHLVLSNRVHTILSKELINPTKSNP